MNSECSVLHVITGLASKDGGPSRSVPSQCSGVRLYGFRVGIVFINGEGQLSEEGARMALDGVSVWTYRKLTAPMRLWREIKNYDVVHVNGIWNFINHLACLYARLQKKPLVITPHGTLDPWSLAQKKQKKSIALRLYQRKDLEKADVLHATCDMEARYFRDLGLKADLAVIANGIQFPDSTKRPANRSKKGRRMLFLSRIHPKKGVMELVRAVAALRKELKRGNWTVIIAGPGNDEYLREVKREANRLNVMTFLEFPGAFDGPSKWELYDSSHIFILPTHSENFGLVVAEALGRGIPVITTQGAPWKELITHRCGWWPAVDQEAIVASMRKALRTPDKKLKEMGERGRSLVLNKYDHATMGRQLTHLYLWLLGKEPMPTFINRVEDAII